MEIAFESKELRTICESEAEANARYGPDVARTLRNRLADLRAARSFNDLPFSLAIVSEDASGCTFALELGSGYQLRLRPNHIVERRTASGALDVTAIRRVRITSIALTHGT